MHRHRLHHLTITFVFLGLSAAPVGAEAAKSLVGSKPCTWGPSYWCQDVRSARECGAFKHCLTAVWLKRTFPKSVPSATCSQCKDTINVLHNVVGRPENEKLVKEYLSEVCNLIPTKVLKEECTKLIADYLPEIFQFLEEQLDPDALCQLIRLCEPGATEIPQNAAEKKSSAPEANDPHGVLASIECTICEFVMRELDSILVQNATEQEIIQALDQVCNLLPSTVRQDCQNFIAKYTPGIIHLLVNQLQPDAVCRALGLCPQLPKPHKRMLVLPPAGPQDQLCVLCEFVINELEKILLKNATEKEIIQALDQVCKLLPDSLSQECVSFLDQYGAQILHLLINQLQPGAICRAIGLCPRDVPAPLLKKPKTEKRNLLSSVECTLCEFVMRELDSILAKNATVQQIIHALDEVCNLLPASVRQECVSLINEYGPAILHLLINQLKPDMVCKELGLCPSSPRAHKKVRGPQLNCLECEAGAMLLHQVLSSDESKVRLERVAELLCQVLPASTKAMCKKAVDGWTPLLVKELLKATSDPKNLCQKYAFCSARKKKAVLKTGKRAPEVLSLKAAGRP